MKDLAPLDDWLFCSRVLRRAVLEPARSNRPDPDSGRYGSGSEIGQCANSRPTGSATGCAVAGDFFADPLPPADVTMGVILHDWNLDRQRPLIAKAYEALPEAGAFVVVEALIDDARR
jgi:hypothetical protein